MSNFTLDSFIDSFASALDINYSLDPDILLAEIEEFDSMGQINTALLIDELFGFQISFDSLSAISTLRDLYNYSIKQANPE